MGDGHIDDFPPTLPSVLAAPKVRFVVAHRQKGPVDSNRDNTLEQNLEASRAFEGEADSSQSNSLSGAITVTISDVLPNGNLVVRGEKWLTLNQGEEYIQISGIVRPQDVGTNNTILSTQIGDARITYSGEGVLAESNKMGWLARFFNHPVWPF